MLDFTTHGKPYNGLYVLFLVDTGTFAPIDLLGTGTADEMASMQKDIVPSPGNDARIRGLPPDIDRLWHVTDHL